MRDEVFGRIMFVACIIVLGAMLCTKGWTGTLDEAHAWMAELGTKTSPEGWRSIGWMTLTLFSVHYVAGKWRGPSCSPSSRRTSASASVTPT